MEIKFRKELEKSAGRVDSMCQELSNVLDDKDFALKLTVQSLNGDQTALEDRLRSENELELDSLKQGSVAKKMRS